MGKTKRLLAIAGILLMGSFFGNALAAEVEKEYTDPAKQAKWEERQQKQMEETEHRRVRLDSWVARMKKLKPHRIAHPDDQVAGTTVTNIQSRGGMK